MTFRTITGTRTVSQSRGSSVCCTPKHERPASSEASLSRLRRSLTCAGLTDQLPNQPIRRPLLSRGPSGSGVVHLLRRRLVLPRGGWIFDEDLSQVLWCPRPPSVQWPRRNVSAVHGQPPAVKKGKGKGQAKGAGKGVGKGAGKAKGQTDVASRRGVAEPSPEGRERVVRLQAVLDAMGNADGPEFSLFGRD